jgi:hypothetical protein
LRDDALKSHDRLQRFVKLVRKHLGEDHRQAKDVAA